MCWLAPNVECSILLIDPHIETALQAANLLGGHEDRVVLLDFNDPDYVVAYNPFAVEIDAYGRLAVEYVNSLKHLFDSGSFPRMNHLLSRALYATMVLGENLSVIPALLSRTAEGEQLRRRVAREAPNAEVRRFWASEFYSYSDDAFNPILNRFSVLFMDEAATRVFSEKENRVDIRQFMREGKIVLVALPSSLEVANLLGGLLVAHVQKAALARIGTPETGMPCYLFVDEFHRFATGARILESLVTEAVKANVHTCLAHQETGQLSDDLLKAAWSVPNLIAFNVNYLDARRLSPVFNARVSVEDFLGLRVGEVYARLDTDLAQFRCPSPPTHHDPGVAARIRELSRAAYYTQPKPPPAPRRGPRVIDTIGEDE